MIFAANHLAISAANYKNHYWTTTSSNYNKLKFNKYKHLKYSILIHGTWIYFNIYFNELITRSYFNELIKTEYCIESWID